MSARNIIQTTFDEFGKGSGGSKNSGSWYWRGPESIFVLNLQKSQYGPQYYVNVAVWLLAAGPAANPKPSHCHIQTRLGQLVPGVSVERLLNLDASIDEAVRRDELLALFRSSLLPVMDAASTLQGLRTGEGQRLVNASLVDGDGQRLIFAGRADR